VSSCATACGLQALIDLAGWWRVLGAMVVGAFCKVFLRKPGMFYKFAG
jgi:hypothetical protein